MARIRSTAIALSTVLALAVGGSAATAQDQTDGPPMGATLVQGTSTLVGQAEPGEQTVEDGVIKVRGNVLLTVETSTDPRVEGRATITVNIDTYPPAEGAMGPAQIRYGTVRLENDGGAWTGSFEGRMAPSGFIQTYWFRGEGGYDGLSYIVTAGGNGNVWQSQGVIYPGELPPLGGVTLPRIDRLGPGAPSAGLGVH
jgi:hypothetical protein